MRGRVRLAAAACLAMASCWPAGASAAATTAGPRLPVTLTRHSATSDAATAVTWNRLAFDTVRSLSLSDAQAARLYAMVNVALYDAVNGIDSQTGIKRQPALVPTTGAPKKGSTAAAACAAAHAVLTQLYPARTPIYDAQLAIDLAAIADGSDKSDGRSWGISVGNAVHALRLNDGSAPNETQPGGSGVGVFRAAWSGVQFRHLAPFVIADPAAYATIAPPALTSADYAAAFNEVKTVGSAATPDAAALETFQFWASASGSVQPPGEWVKVAAALIDQRALALTDSVRLLALVSVAMSDSVAPAFTMKFNNHSWRPATAIREADLDGNPDTAVDTAWAPRGGGIGSTPETVSGHSVFAGAATAAMRGYFCDDNIAFDLETDSAPNGARHYASFTQAASEAGRSRVLGGVHFEFSNAGGLQAGRDVAAEVLGKALLRVNGVTHLAGCPR